MVWKVLTLCSAIAFLAIAVLAARRAGSHRLAASLGLSTLGLFAYNMLELVAAFTVNHPWLTLAYTAAPLAAIPTLSLLIGFIGRSKQLRWLWRLSAVWFALLGLASAAGLLLAPLASFAGSAPWAAAMLVGLVLSFGPASFWFWRHARRAAPRERARCQLFAGALLLGLGSVMNDLTSIAGADLPRISAAGLALCAVLVAALVLRTPILERTNLVAAANAGIIALVAVIALVIMFRVAGAQPALLFFCTLLVVVALMAALRPRLITYSEQRARSAELAMLGRFAQQMAHDIRNPLAAISGAVQLFDEERRQGRSLDPHAAFLEVIGESADRIERVVADYQRLARVEPVLQPADVNELVRKAVATHQLAAPELQTKLDLQAPLPALKVDADLLLTAFDNVLRNAREALDAHHDEQHDTQERPSPRAARSGGLVRVSTEQVTTPLGDMVRISIADNGPGMDVRTQEQATESFFSTKAKGVGLGLAFVVRVAEAHGGSCRLHSLEERGTTVAIDLPISA